MDNLVKEFTKGRKTFFITPDKDLISPAFMEEYLSKDYECYFIQHDLNNTIQEKVEAIATLFSDCILFFNIDYHIEGVDWHELIENTKKRFSNVCIGVVYAKRKIPIEKTLLEQEYIFRMGLSSGCIQLEYQKNTNFILIEKVLYANQAMGRRKNVRVVCLNNSSFNLDDGHGNVTTYWLNDVSLSHFSFTIATDEPQLTLKEYEKVQNLSFVIKGMRFTSDAILFMKRQTSSGTLYVFAFVDREGKVGLDDMRRKLMVSKMYEMLSEACVSLLKKYFVEQENKKPIIKHRPASEDLPEVP